MTEEDKPFRVNAVISLAIVPHAIDAPLPVPERVVGTADRCRSTVSRMRLASDVRDAMYALVEAIQGLEQEVVDLRQRLNLERQGVVLKPELVLLGADGLRLQRSNACPPNIPVACFLSLSSWSSEHLHCFRGHTHIVDGELEVSFANLSSEQRDAIVAFCFQQQAKERRRALDPVAGS